MTDNSKKRPAAYCHAGRLPGRRGHEPDNSNKRSRCFRPAGDGQPKAGMTSVANSSAERRVSANVMSPNANSSEK
jgi:hypothetical protein